MKRKKVVTTAVVAAVAVATAVVGACSGKESGGGRMIGAVETAESVVAAPLDARVAHVYVAEGDYVKAGDTLLVLVAANPDVSLDTAAVEASAARIDAATSVLQQAQDALTAARRSYDEAQKRYDRGETTAVQRDEARSILMLCEAQERAARAQYERAVGTSALPRSVAVTAQAEGELTRIACQRGDMTKTGDAVAVISILDDVWGRFELTAEQQSRLSLGDTIQVRVPAFGTRIAMQVVAVSEQVDYPDGTTAHDDGDTKGVHSYEMRARPLEPVDGLRTGMTLEVRTK